MSESDRGDVEKFLKSMKQKAKVFDIVFLDRDKNAQTLLDLELTANEREEEILSLEPENYSSGPLEEEFHGGKNEMWIFGKQIEGEEIYIKITLGRKNKPVICISFHFAEHTINYPLSN